MANTPKRLYVGKPTTSNGTLYTVPGNTTTIVKNIILTNTAANEVTVNLYFVPNGSSSTSSNQILSSVSISSNTTTVIDMAGVLEEGDKISADSTGASIYISGLEVV